jgi:hypothetical protein
VHKVNPEYTPEALPREARRHGVAAGRRANPRRPQRHFGACAPSTEDSVSISRPSAALRQWRFAPGQRAGQPVPVLVQVEMNFSLK